MRKVMCGGEMIEYELYRKSVKNLNLRVERDGTVRVSAPKSVTAECVDEFVCKNIEFIQKVRERYAALPKREKGVVYFLGRRYEYDMRRGERDRVVIEDGKMVLETVRPEDETYEKLIWSAYEEEMCRSLFPEVVARMLPLVEPYGVKMPKISVRRMKTRWGSCTMAKGSIRLNADLIHYPMECIEQVALHELCHFVHGDHSKDFYALMTRLMPDWKERKKRLEESVMRYRS